jgi:hypothetical protein
VVLNVYWNWTMRIHRRLFAAVIGVASATFSRPADLSAQDLMRMSERTFYITLVSDTNEASGEAQVIRRRSLRPHDIVVVNPTRVAEADLAVALELMERLKAESNDSVDKDFQSAASGPLNRPFRAGESDRLRQYLWYLSTAPMQDVAGVGFAHTIAMTVPRAAFADKLERRSPKLESPARNDSTARRSSHPLRKGILVGTAVGIGAGLIGGSFYQTGCPVSAAGACSETRNRIGLMLFSGAEGGAAGATIGLLVGLLRSRFGTR